MSRHSARDGMDSEFDVYPPMVKLLVELLHCMLRLSHCHSVSRDDNYAGGVFKHKRGVLRAR